ncbi:MAG: 2-oxo-4-hydroxy-4-carboxy-5-ureidoimidazoline decarboxylase [Psychromonas sp.]|jgi:2-oxo-4-hydroxy-4-carboxy-5-ureidoimidazoline decarboxylase|uniref:2-oxo-4-hydroxy-4-carboxy-5-ureidoimidazoline decarboxylase n=1 Tax=Psychromonas sp. TaxID=1884585 RepID=UPI0039E41852
MSLNEINSANLAQAYALLENCCCAPNWVESMLSARPFADSIALLTASEKSFLQLTKNDYLAAFAGHPQIGDLTTLLAKYANTSDSAGHEQAGMSDAEKSVVEEMHNLNQQYLQKFGFIFIVCASGKSAPQMLELIKKRISNDSLNELNIAANEQAKITTLRLEKLL